MDWSAIGVDATIISTIVALVQILKASLFKNLPSWSYLVVTTALSAVVGYATVESPATVELYLRAILSWAAAATFLYDSASRMGFRALLKGGKTLRNDEYSH